MSLRKNKKSLWIWVSLKSCGTNLDVSLQNVSATFVEKLFQDLGYWKVYIDCSIEESWSQKLPSMDCYKDCLFQDTEGPTLESALMYAVNVRKVLQTKVIWKPICRFILFQSHSTVKAVVGDLLWSPTFTNMEILDVEETRRLGEGMIYAVDETFLESYLRICLWQVELLGLYCSTVNALKMNF